MTPRRIMAPALLSLLFKKKSWIRSWKKLSDRIHGISVDDTYITYQMDKHPTSTWAGLLGVQYQFNKRWQLRSESNFISGDRLSIMLSLNYRFLGFRKSKQNT